MVPRLQRADLARLPLLGDTLFGGLGHPLWLGMIFLWLFAAILGSSLAVVRHAEYLAARLGEPLGTLLLTLSVTFIEVASIAAIMLHGANNPSLARDTLFAVVMIILNGMVGLSLLLGGWRIASSNTIFRARTNISR